MAAILIKALTALVVLIAVPIALAELCYCCRLVDAVPLAEGRLER